MVMKNSTARWLAIAIVLAALTIGVLTTPHANAQQSAVSGPNPFRLLGGSISPILGTYKFGVGTTTPWAKMAITGTAGQTNPLFQVASSTNTPVFTIASDGTATFAGNITISGTCTGCSAGGSTFDFTTTTQYGTTTSATSTPLFLRGSLYSLFASSTAVLTNASSTLFSNTGTAYFGSTGQSTFSSTGVLSLGTALAAGSGGTGLTSLGSGVATWFGTPSSANLFSAVTDETGGSGVLVGSAGPTFTGTTAHAAGTFSTTLAVTGQANLGTTTIALASTTPKRDLTYKSSAVIECSLTDGATITFNLRECNQARVTLAGSRTIDFTNEGEAMGQSIRFVVCQNGTGSNTLTWDSAVIFAGGTAPTLTTTGNKCDVIAGFVTAATGTPRILLDKSLNF